MDKMDKDETMTLMLIFLEGFIAMTNTNPSETVAVEDNGCDKTTLSNVLSSARQHLGAIETIVRKGGGSSH